MSLSPVSLAASLVTMQGAATGQALATAMVKQQADAEASVVGLVEQALEVTKGSAKPPPGQGTLIDVSV